MLSACLQAWYLQAQSGRTGAASYIASSVDSLLGKQFDTTSGALKIFIPLDLAIPLLGNLGRPTLRAES